MIISPEAGYGKSHLIGRLFQKLEGTATRINIQPSEDSETPWESILDRIVYELKAPEKAQADGPNPNETTQLHAFAHGVIAHLVADMIDTDRVRAKQPKAEVIKALREGRLANYEQARAHKQWPQFIAKTFSQVRVYTRDGRMRRETWDSVTIRPTRLVAGFVYLHVVRKQGLTERVPRLAQGREYRRRRRKAGGT